jgi:hydrogenase-4 component F
MLLHAIVALLFLMPVSGVAVCMARIPWRHMRVAPVCSAAGALLVSGWLLRAAPSHGSALLFNRNVVVDALSLYHILLVNAIFLVAAVYAIGYFGQDDNGRASKSAQMRRYCMLWQAFHAMLLLVLLSNNVGMMWVALEATTLVSAFLILSDGNKLSIEAMWKYLLICSTGIVFAFMGTVLTLAAAKRVDVVYLFSELHANASLIDPKLMLFAFIFLVVGYGAKAGLSPMHTWLPDAHSQAPTPVSAVFSGVMLNCALYCIMRYLPVAEGALGKNGQALSILLLLGVLSLLFAAVFAPVQQDMKRFLAYCSIEHIGIIAVGLALGGAGPFVALLHTLNHSLAKTLAFFAAGRVAQQHGTRDMGRIRAAVRHWPLWGGALFLSFLILVGVAPFALFMSEFLLLREAVAQGRIVLVVLLLGLMLVVFVSALRYALDMCFGPAEGAPARPDAPRVLDLLTVTGMVAVLLVLGVWIPSPLNELLRDAGAIVQNGIAR